MKAIAGKHAIVVGAASGIGRAIALSLAREGAHLYLIDLDAPRLAVVAEEARLRGVQVIMEACDAAKPDDVNRVVTNLIAAWGAVEILVNSTGNLYWGATHQMSAEQCEHVLAANLLATVLFTRELLPLLLSRDESHILNVASFSGLIAAEKRAVYSASKFGIVRFSESLSAEYARSGLRVTALCPGFVSGTRLFKTVMTPPNVRFEEPEEWERRFRSAELVAATAIQSIKANRLLVIGSSIERMLWAWNRLCPGPFDWLQMRTLRPRVARGGMTEPGFSVLEDRSQ